jgi:hypothetical protein
MHVTEGSFAERLVGILVKTKWTINPRKGPLSRPRISLKQSIGEIIEKALVCHSHSFPQSLSYSSNAGVVHHQHSLDARTKEHA